MNIKYCEGLKVAHKVRACLNKIVPSNIAKNMWVESWTNCREQGFCFACYLKGKSYRAVVAENRNSDDIIVIVGHTDDFNLQHNQPNESLWKTNRKYFEPGNYQGAAEHILKYFQEKQ